MKLKNLLFFLFFSLIFFSYGQNSKHDSWILDIDENINIPLSDKETQFIKIAYGEEVYNRITSIKALEFNIKDILRNRVQILSKKFNISEGIPKLSSISSLNTPIIFNQKRFNPLLYDFDFESKQSQIYRVDGTDYVINIIPKKIK